MKVIKIGKVTWSRKITCASCKSQLEVDFSDVKVREVTSSYTDDYGSIRWKTDEYRRDYYVRCLVCNNVHSFTVSDFEGYAWQALAEKPIGKNA